MSVDSEKWPRVKSLFEAAVARSPEKRESFLEQACDGDHELFEEVASLLNFDRKAGAFIETPAVSSMPEFFVASDSASLDGRRIGNYLVVKEIGHGGMGAVYLAVRADEEFKRQVAIKLVKRGFDNALIVRRFLTERQILANLDHPHIAKLLDGGSTDDGEPYLVMDYIEGQPIDEFCESHQLSIADRLNLFRTVCGAVAHAHRNLVIHRDLKPGNVLVTNEAKPKLLDFGIAKILGPSESESDRTATIVRLMTPDYASPEQVRGEKITTSSDIYSLGVMLYKILTGHQPYRLTTTRPQEIERIICEQEPTKPSSVVSGRSSVVSRKKQSAKRNDNAQLRTDNGQLTTAKPAVINPKLLSGDLDNIVLMAMRKEPERRYSSAEQLSEDIRRYLEGLPVIACKDTFNYRAGKFINRHRVGSAFAVLALLALIGGVSAILWQARVARQQRDLARTEAAKLVGINSFLQDVFSAAAPEARGSDVKVADVLADATRRAKTELADQPQVQAEVLLTLGKTYNSLAQLKPAEDALRAALAVSLKANGENNQTTAQTLGYLCRVLGYDTYNPEAESFGRRSLAIQRRLNPQNEVYLAESLYALAVTLLARGDWQEAEPMMLEGYDLARKNLPPDHGYLVAGLNGLGFGRAVAGDNAKAESYFRQAVEQGRHLRSEHRVWYAQALFFLGTLLAQRNDLAEAEPMLLEAKKIYAEVDGPVNIAIGEILLRLGNLYFANNEYEKAAANLRESISVFKQADFSESAVSASSYATLGVTLTRLGKPKDAEQALREALRLREKLLPPNDPLIALAKSGLGESLTAQKRYAEAEPLLLESFDQLKQNGGEQNTQTERTRERIEKLYTAWGRPDKAPQYRAKQ
jgi:serine/threonine-protein kinase